MIWSKKIYFVDYTGYGHPEWNIFVDDEGLKELLNDIEKYGLVRPDIFLLDVETMKVLLNFLGRHGICGLEPEALKEVLEKMKVNVDE